MVVEDFTTYVPVDDDGDFTITPNRIDVDTMRDDAISYVYSNKAPNYFGDFIHLMTLHLPMSPADIQAISGIWAINNSGQTYTEMRNNNEGIVIFLNRTGSGDRRLYALDCTTGNYAFHSPIGQDTIKYLTIIRSGSVFTVEIYDDINRTILEGTLTINPCTTATYSNIQGAYSNGVAGVDDGSWTFAIENLDLQAPPDCLDPLGYIGDIICGDPAYGQDPTHEYQCTGTGWADLGHSSVCDTQEPCTGPVGTHGQIDPCGDGGVNQPETTHSYQCNDAIWNDIGENCPACPDCSIPPQDCTNPTGTHGQIDPCGDGGVNQPDTTHSYQCNDGTWNDIGENCPACSDCPPPSENNLVFIHHSCGQNWLNHSLHNALLTKSYIDERNDIYYDVDLNPDPGRPDSLTGQNKTDPTQQGQQAGDFTNMDDWLQWFNDYFEGVKYHGSATGYNHIIMFKSCFSRNVDVKEEGTEPGDPFDPYDSLVNHKAVYRHPSGPGNTYTHTWPSGETADYFALEDIFVMHPEILFIPVTYPPTVLNPNASWPTTPEHAALARQFNDWLTTTWINDYKSRTGLDNVAPYYWFDLLANPPGHQYANVIKTEYRTSNSDPHPNALANQHSTEQFATNPANFIDTAWAAFMAPPDCFDPLGMMGDIICGNPAYGQDPTHEYQCTGTGWVDLGYSTTCDLQEPCANPPGVHGDVICGDPTYGQDPTHLYECIDGVWTDIGYSSTCDLEEPCTNPPGVHGDIICGDPTYGQDPTHQYQCIDGVWTDLGYSAICDTQQPCINPPGVHGDIICGDASYGQDPTHQYQCIDGIWTDLGYNSGCDTQESCINPPGTHGDIICGDATYGQDPTHQYQCIDGVWTDLGYSTICDTQEPCVNPSGTHGDIICGNPAYGQDPTHQYECVDGQWVDLGYDPNCDIPLTCNNPTGNQGDIICGNPAYGQDPTHLYECQCIGGVCDWVDLGHSSTCDLEEPCTNPPGVHGGIICGDPTQGQDPTHQYQCIDGIWTDLGHSSTCDVQEPCVNPDGTHGQIDECGVGYGGQPDTTHRYQCNDGSWDDLGENCPYCPDCYVPPQDCLDPAGIHSQIDLCGIGYGGQPRTTHEYECIDGTWYDGGENCPYCPDCEQPLPNWVAPVVIGGILGIGAVGAYIIRR